MSAPQAFFVAGTDTGVGKTLVSAALLRAAREAGLSTAGCKPVAAGGEDTPEGLRNEDALALWQASSVPLAYEQVNPLCLREPASPHIAADLEGRRLGADRIAGYCRGVLGLRAGFTLVEGAGGWLCPISPRETLADVARLLQLPVILVVGMRLGCLNHALLSARMIRADGLRLAGWVANSPGGHMPHYAANRDWLASALGAPLLGEVPPVASVDEAVSALAEALARLGNL